MEAAPVQPRAWRELEDAKAPNTQSSVALTMWMIMGAGASRNLA
jgi:hypothetical protein